MQIYQNEVKPLNFDVLNSEIKLFLDHENLILKQVFKHLKILVFKVQININMFFHILISIKNLVIILQEAL